MLGVPSNVLSVRGKMLTNTEELNARLARAQAKRRAAMAEESRLRRAAAEADRRTRSTALIAIGAALLRALESGPQHAPAVARLIGPHVTRDNDRQAVAVVAPALLGGGAA